mmetsp:Transcript_3973/g.9217  ORF Transcript_3973/g.9217 Transcript_3973/m.9217 type:complete len:213 (+) Transcript_3973:608-1246(+)
MPSSISALASSKLAFSSVRILVICCSVFARLVSSLWSSASWLFSSVVSDVALSIFVETFSTSACLSASFTSVSDISLSHQAFCCASSPASFCRRSTIAETRFFTFLKGSAPDVAPLASPVRSMASMREASCANAADFWLNASFLTKRTAFTSAEPEDIRVWKKEAVWASLYTIFSAPPVMFSRIFLASVRAFISSALDLVSSSKSEALLMQL